MSILEVLIYISCSIVLCSLALHLAFCVHKATQEHIQTADDWIALGIALHRLLDDLKQTNPDLTQWKKHKSDEVIFTLQGKDCGWAISKGRLLRITGIYSQPGLWAERATSVVLDSLESLILKYRYYEPERLASIQVIVSTKRQKLRSLEGQISFKQEGL